MIKCNLNLSKTHQNSSKTIKSHSHNLCCRHLQIWAVSSGLIMTQLSHRLTHWSHGETCEGGSETDRGCWSSSWSGAIIHALQGLGCPAACSHLSIQPFSLNFPKSQHLHGQHNSLSIICILHWRHLLLMYQKLSHLPLHSTECFSIKSSGAAGWWRYHYRLLKCRGSTLISNRQVSVPRCSLGVMVCVKGKAWTDIQLKRKRCIV